MKPATMGSERNSATQPTRNRPAITRTMPAVTARPEVSSAARAGSPPESWPTRLPESSETVDTGPTMSNFDEPKIA